MHGGVKVYRGSPSAAAAYVDQGCSAVEGYYLGVEGAVARRFAVGPDGLPRELTPLTGEAYERWVAGVDPGTGEPRGLLRVDGSGVRFVEVTVNGPKSWSIAGLLHPDIAAAYDAAQDAAANQVIGWLGAHATTRVGPRGAQVATPVELLEAVTVKHLTSRAGDPHRHLHLQVNARVFAAGKWRGLDTVAVRDMIAAVNGIGHAAVATDPGFRAALAKHGYTLSGDGEIAQLVPVVSVFSKRARQIQTHLDRFEVDWRAAHPGQEPGPGLRRAWDARAWATGRPDKQKSLTADLLRERWLGELATAGHVDPEHPVNVGALPVGRLDRDRMVAVVLGRLGAARSGWNAADIRGEVEIQIAAAGVVCDPAVRVELAEDLTARAVDACLPLLPNRVGVPEHVRALTSPAVLEVEADLVDRLTARTPQPDEPSRTDPVITADGLDPQQREAAAKLAGADRLVVVEGAAGAGKTTMLAAARAHLAEQGRGMVIVTPTLQAAQVAGEQTGAEALSAARLAFGFGWRWDEHGTWTRLRDGDIDPVNGHPYTAPEGGARVMPGGLLVIDEAAMLTQDTARALLVVADEHRWRVALVGDRHQLPAVGRGGVLDRAARLVRPVPLEAVHRFTTADSDGRTVTDREYARLSIAMRTGIDPAAVFDQLTARGNTQLHTSTAEVIDALAELVAAERAAGGELLLLASTREQVTLLNEAVRARLVAAGLVDDTGATMTTGAGERIGVGDLVATRRNDRGLGVANRQSWTVTAVGLDGTLIVTAGQEERTLPPGYARRYVELVYARTVHGAQGATVQASHLLLDAEHATAAAVYVGMTRGRHANTAHLIATDPDEARAVWVEVFGRDRADLGPAHAASLAARDATRYALPAPTPTAVVPPEVTPAPPRQDPQVPVLVDRLRAAWTEQLRAAGLVAALQHRLDQQETAARDLPDLTRHLGELEAAQRAATARQQDARAAASASDASLARHAEQLVQRWQHEWDAARPDIRAAATRVAHGPGRFGLGRGGMLAAQDRIDNWAAHWAAILTPTGPTPWYFRPADYARTLPTGEQIRPRLERAAEHAVAQVHPEHPARHAELRAADQAKARVRHDLFLAGNRHTRCVRDGDPEQIARTRTDLAVAGQHLQNTSTRVEDLTRAAEQAGIPVEQLRALHRDLPLHPDHHHTPSAAPRPTYHVHPSPQPSRGIGL
jgi:hypothetical protein